MKEEDEEEDSAIKQKVHFPLNSSLLEQAARLHLEEKRCQFQVNSTKPPTDAVYCPQIWDGAYCWPYTSADTVAVASCPDYIHGFNPEAFASKKCGSDGTWWTSESLNVTWTNYSHCQAIETGENEESIFLLHIPRIRLISQVGYSLSLALLIVAFLILALIKKLRCPRNNLHMHLFLSFIMRAFFSLLRYNLFKEGFSDSKLVTAEEYAVFIENVDCKIFTSIWQYFLVANYFWILMEGLYLHNLVFLSMFTDTSGILKYILLGWGLPIFFIIPWVIAKAQLEDILCWTLNKNSSIFWITRGPITASIIVNFIFFLNITRVLFLKMFSSQVIQSRRYRYRKWFKSTLVLVPLFGVHYAVLLSISLAAEINKIVELVWLYIDQAFSSFQGSFVAFLYCFLNGEVKSELRKLRQRLNMQSDQPVRPHHSLLTQSLTYLSRGRSSILSLQSTVDRRENYRSTSPSPHPPAKGEVQLETRPRLSSPQSSSYLLGNEPKISHLSGQTVVEMDHPPNGALHQEQLYLQSHSDLNSKKEVECEKLLLHLEHRKQESQKESKL